MDKKFNILIADDEKEIIKVLRLFLEKENFTWFTKIFTYGIK